MVRRVLLLCAALLLASCHASCLAPKAELLDAQIAKTIANAPPRGSKHFDHSRFDALLAEHVRYDAGRVDYAGLKKDADALDAYLQKLAGADLSSLDRPELEALLIDAYNAFTLHLILEHYPHLASIRDLDDPWGTRRYDLGGTKVSLDDVEHGLLRPIFRDPRIHFAVNCASIGCPKLAPHAYVGGKVGEQLDAAARSTLSDPRYARLTDDGTLQLTRVMSWYGDDFTNPKFSPRADTIPGFVAKFTDDPHIKARVDGHPGEVPVEFMSYDWRLNDVQPK